MKLFTLILLTIASQSWAANTIDFQFTAKTKQEQALIYAYPPGSNKNTMKNVETYSAYYAICSINPAAKASKGQPITCLAFQDGSYIKLIKGRLDRYRYVNAAANPRFNRDAFTEDFIEIDQAEIDLQPLSSFLYPSQLRTFENFISLMSPERPLHLVFDADTGKWSYGLNPASLLPLK